MRTVWTLSVLAAGCAPASGSWHLEPSPPPGVPTSECRNRWDLPRDTLTAGAAYDAPYQAATGCTGSASTGALTLAAHMLDVFPQVLGVGVYDCRLVQGGTAWSLHAEGRAIDLDLAPDTSAFADANNTDGDPIANWLVDNAEALGVMSVVWDRTVWRADDTPPKNACYDGVNPHHDHVHVSLSWEAANAETPWFQGAPLTSPTGARTGAEILIIDDDDTLNDPADHHVEIGADFRWSDNVSWPWASGYHVAPVEPGAEPFRFWFHETGHTCYQVQAWWPDSRDRAPDATWVAFDAGGLELGRAVVDQTGGDRTWNPLGTWRFSPGWNHVDLLRDGTLGTWVVADGLRLVPDPDCGAVCGDGIVEDAETCDDGGAVDGDGCSADCAIEPLLLDAPWPGIAGLTNDLVASNVAPDETITFVASERLGSKTVPGCPGLDIPLGALSILGHAPGTAEGTARTSVDVPSSMAGTTAIFVAVSRDSCRASDPWVQTL